MSTIVFNNRDAQCFEIVEKMKVFILFYFILKEKITSKLSTSRRFSSPYYHREIETQVTFVQSNSPKLHLPH